MLETRKSITLTGTSTIEYSATGNKVNVVIMSANISENGGNPNITKTITDRQAYLENKEAVKTDMDTFEEEAWKLVED
jgi:hypothetical protein